ncbi:thioesterase II family protein [Pleionea litopenaei]|uniref:Thioesterase domain-containing protein n=1 Tax=Pleionea litopenaei TaxID=3070815 RepID=A0AA51X6X9_9GAMM|nr:thioesterase domain-containing protein [Pleionea sp. HL-JVS1]WMS87311.1 thioesterase domain-containing protein [Pleionea sp. HL-JVS1]
MGNSFFLPQSRPDAKLNLICFPYAGGSAASYINWIKFLPSEVQLIIAQPPGRADRIFEKPHTTMQDMIDELMGEFPKFTTCPYIMFGHSLGSRVAFEILKKSHELKLEKPRHFIASASRGPHVLPREDTFFDLNDDEFKSELANINGTPLEILENSELMELLLPLLRADFTIADTYINHDKVQFNCPLSIFGGTEDRNITKSDLLSWGNFFSQEPSLYYIKGDHFYIDKNIYELSIKLRLIINQTLNGLESTQKISLATEIN